MKEKFRLKHLPRLFWKAALIWNENNPWRLGAVVAYYAVLALPGLLIILINTVGVLWGQEIVEGQITEEISEAIGENAAQAVVVIIDQTQQDQRNLLANIIGIGVLVFGATGVFYQLQISMNEIWDVKLDPKAGIWKLVKDRALSLAFVMVFAFLLIVSFVVSTALSVMSNYLARLWEPAHVVFAQVAEFVVSTAVLGFLFVLIFKFMPDKKVKWSSVWLGGIITALLFNGGKTLMSLYFDMADPASTYGAAGSVVLILLWVSYSCLILFYGAAFTRAYSERYGLHIPPDEHAMEVKKEEKVVEKGSDVKEE